LRFKVSGCDANRYFFCNCSVRCQLCHTESLEQTGGMIQDEQGGEGNWSERTQIRKNEVGDELPVMQASFTFVTKLGFQLPEIK